MHTEKINNFLIFITSLYFSALISLINENLYDLLIGLLTIIFCTWIFYFSKKINTLSILTKFIFIIITLYYPFSLNFKITTPGVLTSILNTNRSEAIEFLNILNFYDLLFYATSFVFFIIYTVTKIKSKNKKKEILIILSLIYFYAIVDDSLSKIKNIYKTYSDYTKEINKIITSKNKKDNWEILKKTEQKDVVVVIIGESVNKNYLSIYGSEYETTPFLDKTLGTFYMNNVSPAGFTIESIPRYLAITRDNDIEYETNAVALANKAGYKTYWISNQGYAGDYETATSLISAKSDYVIYKNIFRHRFDYHESHSSNDFNLLKDFNEKIKENYKKVIFLHMLGSHNDFCKRVNDYGIKYETSLGKDFNCYLSSINLLDKFIENIYKKLKLENQKFSIIYFSDHGLHQVKTNNQIKLFHGDRSKENFDVPLFILRHNDNKKTFITETTSGFNFLHIFAKELGVETRNLKVHHPIKVLSQNKFIDYDDLP